MNELMEIKGVRGYIDENGEAHLNIEDVARGLGFTQEKGGVEYVRWERVNQYLAELRFPTSGERKFIPENIFYRLAMKASNETADKFQTFVADEVLPSIRKTGTYSRPLSQLELMHQMTGALLEQDRQLKSLAGTVDTIQTNLQDIRDTISLSPEGWRKDCASIVTRIAGKIGGYEHIETVWTEVYKLLDERLGVNTTQRVTNIKKAMALNGACRSKINKVNRLDAIANDKKLVDGLLHIIKQLAIKHGLGVAG